MSQNGVIVSMEKKIQQFMQDKDFLTVSNSEPAEVPKEHPDIKTILKDENVRTEQERFH